MTETDLPPPKTMEAPRIVIIGTGFGGLGMAIQLKNAGVCTFIMLEKSTEVGGTWRDNTYPGAACDVQSHLYSYSFEPKHDWSRKFGRQAEIKEYMEGCVRKYGLMSHIRFNKAVAEAHYDDATHQWSIITEDGDRLTANVLITATGQLNQPRFPHIEGLDQFKGTRFHSARWDHNFDLTGKTVAVIGTGASAIQFVPEIQPRVKRLKLFQRSAAWVIPKPDRPFRPWEQKLFKTLPMHDRLYRSLIYWKNESRALAFTRFNRLLEFMALQAKWEARKHVRNLEKRKALIPDYKIGCKRILISNDWYPAVDSDNVDLVTTGIARIEENAVVTVDGEHHDVDAIIFGTGFKATQFLSPMTITGRHGQNLNDAWSNGAEAYKGIAVSGFPNLFMLYGPNTNLAHNSIIYMLESQIHYVLECLKSLEDQHADAMDVKPEPQGVYVDGVHRRLEGSIWDSGCTSWYRDESGRNPVNWPGFTFTYRHLTRHVDPDAYTFFPSVSG
ncbi:flavin-containing monooxygenase [Marinobacter mobilis]|uniref:Predicted flavoprotein CzcO associated with the cation diffusion facilitator CzcD n=1 Tax=Marinobacter mobilis TaxID=488533 RepID=A0A1H3BGW6_9GAMM|nr:NAD(P)/FAD-dependent oxidoreductase [Marinobacter mobilis]SDX41230.1 Predicted flavoprotein CzcO associated with the cation diffusion facilitator CzcD [Marinobacter mobilis]